MSRKGRRLSPEEEKLWRRVATTATPLNKDAKPRAIDPTKPFETTTGANLSQPAFRIGQEATRPTTDTRIVAPDHPLRMDRKTLSRMKRGKTKPEARIDLHGMTVDVAHSALNAFLLRSHSQGKRLVLVITGKGRPQDEDVLGPSRGILKRQVPHWLDQPPLRQIVLQTVPAHQRHGGSGALYVYLRR